jgi:hypothetical protein
MDPTGPSSSLLRKSTEPIYQPQFLTVHLFPAMQSDYRVSHPLPGEEFGCSIAFRNYYLTDCFIVDRAKPLAYGLLLLTEKLGLWTLHASSPAFTIDGPRSGLKSRY